MAFKTPLALGISNYDLPWDGYGYILEPLIHNFWGFLVLQRIIPLKIVQIELTIQNSFIVVISLNVFRFSIVVSTNKSLQRKNMHDKIQQTGTNKLKATLQNQSTGTLHVQ